MLKRDRSLVRERMGCFLCGFAAFFADTDYLRILPRRFLLAQTCPSCRGGHLLSWKDESKQRPSKGHLWNPFWGTDPDYVNKSYL